MFTEPEMFAGYGLGSPSFWFDKRHAFRMEANYAAGHSDLPAQVFMYVGDFERPGPSWRNTHDVDMVADVKAMEEALRARNYPGLIVRSAILEDEDHLSVAPRGFTHALIDLLPAQQSRK
jgi:predicted alpha/beta superfamily hydrolase